MVTFLIIAILGYVLLAVAAILDKFILTKSVRAPAIYAFYSSIYFLLLYLAVPFFPLIPTKDFIISLISGIAFGLALWTTYISLKIAETSHVLPFVGGITAIVTFILSYFFGERLPVFSIIAVFILALASILLSYEKTASKINLLRSFSFAALAGILFSVSHVFAKQIYNDHSFFIGLIYTKAPIGLVGLFLLFFSNVRKSFKASKKVEHTTLIVTVDKIAGTVGTVLIQLAISLGSVIIVNALAGVQYAIIFIIAILMTKFRPTIFKEYFTKKEILIQILALLLVMCGLAFFAIQN